MALPHVRQEEHSEAQYTPALQVVVHDVVLSHGWDRVLASPLVLTIACTKSFSKGHFVYWKSLCVETEGFEVVGIIVLEMEESLHVLAEQMSSASDCQYELVEVFLFSHEHVEGYSICESHGIASGYSAVEEFCRTMRPWSPSSSRSMRLSIGVKFFDSGL